MGKEHPPLGVIDLRIEHDEYKATGLALVLGMNGKQLLMGNNFLKQFKRLEIQYTDGEPELSLGEPKVRVGTEEPEARGRTKSVARKRKKSYKSHSSEPPNRSEPIDRKEIWMDNQCNETLDK